MSKTSDTPCSDVVAGDNFLDCISGNPERSSREDRAEAEPLLGVDPDLIRLNSCESSELDADDEAIVFEYEDSTCYKPKKNVIKFRGSQIKHIYSTFVHDCVQSESLNSSIFRPSVRLEKDLSYGNKSYFLDISYSTALNMLFKNKDLMDNSKFPVWYRNMEFFLRHHSLLKVSDYINSIAPNSNMETKMIDWYVDRKSVHDYITLFDSKLYLRKNLFSARNDSASAVSETQGSQKVGDDNFVTNSSECPDTDSGAKYSAMCVSKFLMSWSNPLYRMYLMMYFVQSNYENVYFFVDSVINMKYSSVFDKGSCKSLMTKIYSTFLREDSCLYVGSCLPEKYRLYIVNMTRPIRCSIRDGRPDTFEDIFYMLFHILFIVFKFGRLVTLDSSECGSEAENNQDVETRGVYESFEKSPFYQQLVSDYGLGQVPVRDDIQRTVNRVLASNNELSMELLRLSQLFHSLQILDISTTTTLTKNTTGISKTLYVSFLVSLRSPTVNCPNSIGFSNTAMDETHTKSLTLPRKGPKKFMNLLLDFNNISDSKKKDYIHYFTDINYYSLNNEVYCDYCLTSTASNETKPTEKILICNACGYICHKSCRHMVSVPCFKNSKSYVVEMHNNETRAILSGEACIRERMNYILKEIEIESRVFEGLKTLLDARERLSYRSKGSKKAMKELAEYQMRMYQNNLDALLEKARLYKLAITVYSNSNVNKIDSELNKNSKNQGTSVLSKVKFSEASDKVNLAKLILINLLQNATEVTESIIKRFLLPGSVDDYTLSIEDENGSVTVLLPDEYPIRKAIDFSTCNLVINRKPLPVQDPAQIDKRDKANKLFSQVAQEIITTEREYLDYLNKLENLILKPLKDKVDIKHNVIRSLLPLVANMRSIHASILEKTKKLDYHSLGGIEKLIKAFSESLAEPNVYINYCWCKYKASAFITKLRSNKETNALLNELEDNPKLSRLKLDDILIKPIQRITRYPILFRRISSSLPPGNFLQESLQILTHRIEKLVHYINEMMREKSIINFSNEICSKIINGENYENFSLRSHNREVVSLEEFQMIKNNKTCTRVTVILYHDMMVILKKKKCGNYTMEYPPIFHENSIFLDACSAGEESSSSTTFSILNISQGSIALKAGSYDSKRKWLDTATAVQTIFLYDLWAYHFVKSSEIFNYVRQSRLKMGL